MHPKKAASSLPYAICGFFYVLQLLKMGLFVENAALTEIIITFSDCPVIFSDIPMTPENQSKYRGMARY